MFLKKFYAPDPDFTGAKFSDFTVIDRTAVAEPVQVTETVNPEPEVAGAIEGATTERVAPIDATPAEVTPVVAPAEQPTQTVVPPADTKEVAPPVAQKNWKDLLKEEGFDDKDLAMLDHRKRTGSYKDYLEAMSVNYKDMQPEEIMRRDLREQYPNMTPENFERFYRKQVTEKYNLDTDLSPSEEDTALGREILAHDAEAKRQKFLEKQNSFVIPDKDIAGENQRRVEEEARIASEQEEAFKQSIISSPVARSLVTNKSIVFDAGDGMQFNYAVDNPQEIMDLLLKPEKYQQAMSITDTSGNTIHDSNKTMILAAVAKNPQGVFKALINHGKNLGKKEYIDTLENAGSGSQTSHITGETSLGQTFLANGVRRNF
ncbi:MAG: hypothetical protein WKF70_11035 [Chitinophagaceae bacterium]